MFTLLVSNPVFNSTILDTSVCPGRLSFTAVWIDTVLLTFKLLHRNIEPELRSVQEETEFSLSSTSILLVQVIFTILFIVKGLHFSSVELNISAEEKEHQIAINIIIIFQLKYS